MFKLILHLALGIIFVTAFAKADDGKELEKLKQLCIADESTGFNWSDGDWVKVNFPLEKYIIRKINEIGDDSDYMVRKFCQHHLSKSQTITDIYERFPICLSAQLVGEEDPTIFACDERHFYREKEEKWVTKIDCENELYGEMLKFEPNGFFHRASVHGNTDRDPENDYKDSLFLEVGKCSSISD